MILESATQRLGPRARRLAYPALVRLAINCLAFASAACAHGAPADVSPRLTVLWSVPIAVTDNFTHQEGLELKGAVSDSRASPVFLGAFWDGSHRPKDVIVDDHSDPENPTRLVTPERAAKEEGRHWYQLLGFGKPIEIPAVESFAIDHFGAVWLAGSANPYLDIASDRHSDAYVVRFGKQDEMPRSWTYGDSTRRVVTSIHPIGESDMLIAGSDKFSSWVSKISHDGKRLQDHALGNGKGIAAAPLPDGSAILAAISSSSSGGEYSDDVSVWKLEPNGHLSRTATVREGLSHSKISYYGRIVISPASDGAYLASTWDAGYSDEMKKSVEVARVDASGKPMWRQSIDDSIVKGSRPEVCPPAIATLANGDALLACARDDEIHLDTFDHVSGKRRSAKVALPDCQHGHPSQLFLVVTTNDTFIAGSRPDTNVGANCSWLARLNLPADWAAPPR